MDSSSLFFSHEFPAYWNNDKEQAQKCVSVDISIAVATEKVLKLKSTVYNFY
jgi:hypothetical protein